MNELTTIFRKPIVGDLIYGGDFYYSQITRVGDNVVEFETIGPIADEDAIRGPKGDKGDKGDQGNTGPQGPQGIPGEVQLKDLNGVNLAIPVLEGKEYLGDGVYQLQQQNGGTLIYNVLTGEYRLFGNLTGALTYNFGYDRPSADDCYIQIWKTKQVVWENEGAIIGFGGASAYHVGLTKNTDYGEKNPLPTTANTINSWNILGNIDVSFRLQLKKGTTATPYIAPGQIPQYALKQQEGWITPTLLNGWVHYDNAPLVYRKNQFGVVEFKGAIKNGNNNSSAFFLPAGYRPTQLETYIAHSGGENISIQIGVTAGNMLIYGNNTARTVFFNQFRIFTD